MSALDLQLDPDSGVPLHRQLASALRALIQRGELRPHDPLPGELHLAERLGISRTTVRHALAELSAEGLVRRRKRAGTTVAAPSIQRTLDRLYAFAWEARARGTEPRSQILERSLVVATGDVAASLELPQGTPLMRIVRLRTADGEPLILDTVYLPRELGEGFEPTLLERESLYDVLEQTHRVRVTHARETIRPVVLDERVADTLGILPGSPAFLVDRVTWADQRPVERRRSYVRGDRYLYAVDLPRIQLVTEWAESQRLRPTP